MTGVQTCALPIFRRTIQREIEDVLSEKILFGDVKPGEITLVDVTKSGEEEIFSFVGTPKAAAPDTPGDLAGTTSN